MEEILFLIKRIDCTPIYTNTKWVICAKLVTNVIYSRMCGGVAIEDGREEGGDDCGNDATAM